MANQGESVTVRKSSAKSVKSQPINVLSSKLVLVALDVGFGVTKYISSAHPRLRAFPSAVVLGSNPAKTYGRAELDENNLVVTTEDGTFTIGSRALQINNKASKRTTQRDRSADQFSRVLFQTGIGMSLPHESGSYKVYLVTGLPNSDFEVDEYLKGLETFLNKEFEVRFLVGDREIVQTIEVVGLDIVRQPEGAATYNQFTVSEEAEYFLTQSELARDFLGMIDIGHFTTDYALFHNGTIYKDDVTIGSTYAMNEVYKKLERKLALKFKNQFEPSEADLDRAVKTNTVYYIEEHDVSEEVAECAKEVASLIAQKVLRSWDTETNRLQCILLSGGGAELLAPYLQEEFKNKGKKEFEVMDIAQFTNVLGYYMIGMIDVLYAMNMSKENEEKYKMPREEVFERYVAPVFFGEDEVA